MPTPPARRPLCGGDAVEALAGGEALLDPSQRLRDLRQVDVGALSWCAGEGWRVQPPAGGKGNAGR